MKMIHEFSPFHSGILIKRYKRFLADVKLDDGRKVTAFTPNSGSMKTCSEPGSPVMLTYEPKPGRKTRFTLEMIRAENTWIGVNPMLANTLGAKIIDEGLTGLPDLEGFKVIKREVALEDSRLDLLAANGYRSCYIEVKNVTYREKDAALFPDAVTVRGTKHLETLTRRSLAGDLACNLFIVQRSDCRTFAAASHIDPVYAKALHDAVRAGVFIIPCQLHIEPEAIFFRRTLSLDES
jgi:sugar fermentation stimulation protein A